MGDQTPGIVDNKGVACIADLDRCDDIPDQFEVDVGNDDPGGGAVSRNRDPHVRLGIALIMHRAVPDAVRARADNRGISRHVRAAAGSVHAHAGNENAFGAIASTSESETIAGTCCSKRNPSILRRSSSPAVQGNCTTQPS